MRLLTGAPTDYSVKKNWLSQPENPDKSVDVIYLYPSSCNHKKARVICTVDNKSMVRTARRNFAQQATVFKPVANLYAPFWRQVNAMKFTEMSFEEVDRAIIDPERGTVIVTEPRLSKCVITAIPGLKRWRRFSVRKAIMGVIIRFSIRIYEKMPVYEKRPGWPKKDYRKKGDRFQFSAG